MRHSRVRKFERARPTAAAPPTNERWGDLTDDPNDVSAIAARAATLRAAWRPEIADRTRFLESRCAGRKILDIGCVAHAIGRSAEPSWLHARLAAVASECVGVDVLADEVAELVGQGYRVVAHDLRAGLGPLDAEVPFDVIVAGELIEHVESLDMLFAVADESLAADGELIITTPNPYAPHRVRAGQRGIAWENVDHIMYAFPSGIAELAQRHGLHLAEAATVADPSVEKRPRAMARAAWRRVRGGQWTTHGFSTRGDARPVRVEPLWINRLATRLLRPRRPFVGETFVYVVSRRPS